jgi:hypothetical protein
MIFGSIGGLFGTDGDASGQLALRAGRISR